MYTELKLKLIMHTYSYLHTQYTELKINLFNRRKAGLWTWIRGDTGKELTQQRSRLGLEWRSQACECQALPQPPDDRTRQRISRERGLDSHTLMSDLRAVKEQILDIVGICCLRSRNLAYPLPMPPSVLSIFGVGEGLLMVNPNPFYLPLTVVPTPCTTVAPSCSHLVHTGETNKQTNHLMLHCFMNACRLYVHVSKKNIILCTLCISEY